MLANEPGESQSNSRASAASSGMGERSRVVADGEDTGQSVKAEPAALSSEQRLRRAVLLSFCDPVPVQCLQLCEITERVWRRLLHWLDVSGLALYFLDRLVDLQLTHILPKSVLARLQQNMRDNTARTHGMIAESVGLQEGFQAGAVSYAVLKGFSLLPESVPRPELRHQFDLDFLISEDAIQVARAVIEREGYRLYAVSGKSWEFKKNEKIGISMDDLYKDTAGRTVELHLQARIAGIGSVLDRAVERKFYGIDMPALSPVDLFLNQGMHVYKHICGEFSRAAHLLEFYRHVLTRRQDDVFWAELRLRGEESHKTSVGLGIVTLLITSVMGEFAPPALTEWTVDRLSPAVRLWIKLYGCRAVFGDVPGSKLYLLLQRELEPLDQAASRPLWKVLVPRRLPPAVVLAKDGEGLSRRVRRYRMQLHFVLLRLRFHLVEGIRYGLESNRWKRHLDGLPQ